MYGPPGTGKTLLARACAAQTDATFLKLAGPQLVQMFIGDGAKLVRDCFALAKEKAPAIIFIDELDAVGTKRFDSEKSGDREVQRTMLELLNQLDGFASDDRIKVLAATNRVDVLDPALLRSGRLDRKIEFPLPNEEARAQILKIHSRKMTVDDAVNWAELARSTDEFGGAQLKAVCVEAGMIALRMGKNKISHEHYVDAIAEVQAKKKGMSVAGSPFFLATCPYPGLILTYFQIRSTSTHSPAYWERLGIAYSKNCTFIQIMVMRMHRTRGVTMVAWSDMMTFTLQHVMTSSLRPHLNMPSPIYQPLLPCWPDSKSPWATCFKASPSLEDKQRVSRIRDQLRFKRTFGPILSFYYSVVAFPVLAQKSPASAALEVMADQEILHAGLLQTSPFSLYRTQDVLKLIQRSVKGRSAIIFQLAPKLIITYAESPMPCKHLFTHFSIPLVIRLDFIS